MITIDDECRALVNLSERTGHANHGRDAQALCHDSEVSCSRSSLRDDGLQECGVQSNRLGGRGVLCAKNPRAVNTHLYRCAPPLRHDPPAAPTPTPPPTPPSGSL